jgi:hypothetical protein
MLKDGFGTHARCIAGRGRMCCHRWDAKGRDAKGWDAKGRDAKGRDAKGRDAKE